MFLVVNKTKSLINIIKHGQTILNILIEHRQCQDRLYLEPIAPGKEFQHHHELPQGPKNPARQAQ